MKTFLVLAAGVSLTSAMTTEDKRMELIHRAHDRDHFLPDGVHPAVHPHKKKDWDAHTWKEEMKENKEKFRERLRKLKDASEDTIEELFSAHDKEKRETADCGAWSSQDWHGLSASSSCAGHLPPPPPRAFSTAFAAGSCAVRARSYRRSCGHVGDGTRKKLLVGAVGRSGTRTLHLLLNATGLRIGHDGRHELQEDGAVSWGAVFAPGRVGAWTCSRAFGWSFSGRFDTLVQLVRAPLDQIASRWDLGRRRPGVGRLMRCHTVAEVAAWDSRHPALIGSGVDGGLNWLVDCLRHWVLVNSYVDAAADATLRIEDLGVDAVLKLAALANLSRADGSRVAAAAVTAAETSLATNTNSGHTRKPKDGDDVVSWPSLLRLDEPYAVLAQALALAYGYDVAPRAPDAAIRAACLGDGPSVFDAPPAWPGGVVPAADARRVRPLACFFDDEERWACYLRCDGSSSSQGRNPTP